MEYLSAQVKGRLGPSVGRLDTVLDQGRLRHASVMFFIGRQKTILAGGQRLPKAYF